MNKKNKEELDKKGFKEWAELIGAIIFLALLIIFSAYLYLNPCSGFKDALWNEYVNESENITTEHSISINLSDGFYIVRIDNNQIVNYTGLLENGLFMNITKGLALWNGTS